MAIALNQENTDLQKEVDRVQTTIVALEHLELQLKDEKDRLQTLCDRNTVLQNQLIDLQRHCEERRQQQNNNMPPSSHKPSLWRTRTPALTLKFSNWLCSTRRWNLGFNSTRTLPPILRTETQQCWTPEEIGQSTEKQLYQLEQEYHQAKCHTHTVEQQNGHFTKEIKDRRTSKISKIWRKYLLQQMLNSKLSPNKTESSPLSYQL